nr:mitochondrial thiamine pyrophosphate carrier [Hymenolepis microstoma]
MRDNRLDAFAGFLTGFSVRAITQPLDVLKIRFQLQVENISVRNGGYYQSIPQAISRIVREEGVGALWKGHVPGQILSILFTASEFYWFRAITDRYFPYIHCQRAAVYDAVAGGAAGAISTVICQPIDVVRTRLVGQGQRKVYHGVCHAMKQILRDEGLPGFFKGLSPSLSLIVPQTAIAFATYEKLKRAFSEITHNSYLLTSFSGGFAGCVSKTAVYPLDVAKKRFQVVGFEIARQHFGKLPTKAETRLGLITLCSVWQIVVHEGVRGLFKGWCPSMLKAAVSTSLTFTFFEFYRSLFSGATPLSQ